MAFHFEAIDDPGPLTYVAEHRRARLLIGDQTALSRERTVEAERNAVLYLVARSGGPGHSSFSYVLFFDRAEIRIEVSGASGFFLHQEFKVSAVQLPSRLVEQREVVADLIRGGVAAHLHAFSKKFWAPEDLDPEPKIDMHSVTWDFVPPRYSIGHLRRVLKRRWPTWQRRVKPIKEFLLSPAVATGLLLAMAWSIHGPSSFTAVFSTAAVVLGAWLGYKIMQYDQDLLFGPWLIGKSKYRNPLQSIAKSLSRLSDEPVLYEGLRITITPAKGRPCELDLALVNSGRHVVKSFYLHENGLAELLAPGLLQLPADRRAECLHHKSIAQALPALKVARIAPGKKVTIRRHAVAGFVPASRPVRAVFHLKGSSKDWICTHIVDADT